jgi:hypothetical protein
MKITIAVKKTYDAKTLVVDAGVRYWEDAMVNGVYDSDGTLIPFRYGDRWKPIIDIETGQVVNWPKGVRADIHYKVCDDGCYSMLDENGESITAIIDDYVPIIMCPKENGFGDYIIMDIDEEGFIQKWKPSTDGFTDGNED